MGGQGPYLRSLNHLGRRSEAKDRENLKKVKCDGRTDGPTDGPTDGWIDKAGCSTRLKKKTSSEIYTQNDSKADSPKNSQLKTGRVCDICAMTMSVKT